LPSSFSGGLSLPGYALPAHQCQPGTVLPRRQRQDPRYRLVSRPRGPAGAAVLLLGPGGRHTLAAPARLTAGRPPIGHSAFAVALGTASGSEVHPRGATLRHSAGKIPCLALLMPALTPPMHPAEGGALWAPTASPRGGLAFQPRSARTGRSATTANRPSPPSVSRLAPLHYRGRRALRFA